MGKVTYRNWNAFQGLDKKLSTKEFFSITGYETEASDFGLRTKLPWKAFVVSGFILGYSGLTYEGPSYKDGKYRKSQNRKDLIAPGIVFLSGGIYSMYYLITHPQLTPSELAQEIADVYNNKLIVQLKNQ